METIYLITPFAAWLVTGSIKFLVNSFRIRRLAFKKIGYGGMPSNHSAIISSAVTQVALQEGINNPSFGIGVAFAFIVILDATSLRKQIGLHAHAINQIKNKVNTDGLRESIGHKPIEIFVGLLVGASVAYALAIISDYLS